MMPQTDRITPIVQVREVSKYFPLARGSFAGTAGFVRAVENVSLEVEPAGILGLVGESGCGKSTLGRMILNLLRPDSGSVFFDGMDVGALNRREARKLRKRMQIIFQDPFSSLNPRMSVGAMLEEILAVHEIVPPAERKARVTSLLEMVGLNAFHAGRFPHEFSSGQRQRIGIARAIAVEPDFIVCDEPVSALDVSIQAQIINLLLDLHERLNLAYLFISHDLHVVRHISDRVAVMYLGRIVEIGPTASVSAQPLHPYSRALIGSIPRPDPSRLRTAPPLAGDVPSPAEAPGGCPFHPRCPEAFDACREVAPLLAPVTDGHSAGCLLYENCRPLGGLELTAEGGHA
jgi:oligopeptide/dipeptide ABC transporter ATP-binding protein